jgi:uncharacterized RDD family membrane protein YckC
MTYPPHDPEFPPPAPGGGYPPALGQPAGGLPTHAYASWGQRFLAYLVDMIAVLVIEGVAIGISFATGAGVATGGCTPNPDGSIPSCSGEFSLFGGWPLMLAWLAVLGYIVWNFGYRQGTTGSTIGKGVVHIKVVSEATGQPIGFGMSVVRQIVHIVDGICYIGYLWPLWDAKRQTFADKIMSTIVLPTQ